MQEMRDEEQRLLKVRTITSNRFFSLTVVTLAVSFALSLVLFSIHYRLSHRRTRSPRPGRARRP